MEIEKSWRVCTKNPQEEVAAITSKDYAISPDGDRVYSFNNNYLIRYSSKFAHKEAIFEDSDECITALEAVVSKSFSIILGTNKGRLFIIKDEKKIAEFSFSQSGVLRITHRYFTADNFCNSNEIIFIQYEDNSVHMFEDEDAHSLIEGKPKIVPKYLHFEDADMGNATVVNSSLGGSSFSFTTFPSIYSLGKKSFLTVSNYQTQSPGLVGKFLRRPPSTTLHTAHVFEDNGRMGLALSPSPSGRWIAICDSVGRVSLVDGMFGHIVNMLKGMRSASICWAGKLLVVFAPFRSTLFFFKTPSLELYDAITVSRELKIKQFFNVNNVSTVSIIDENANVAILGKLKRKTNSKTVLKNAETDYYHFALQNFLNQDSTIKGKILKEVMTCDVKRILQIVQEIKDEETASDIVRILMRVDRLSDDDLADCIKGIRFSLPSGTKNTQKKALYHALETDGFLETSEFTKLELLMQIWEASKEEHEPISLFTETQSNEGETELSVPPPPVPLRQFLASPLKFEKTLFASITSRSTAFDVVRIFEAVAPIEPQKFVRSFTYWSVRLSPSQISSVQEAIFDFAQIGDLRSIMLDFLYSLKDYAEPKSIDLLIRLLSDS